MNIKLIISSLSLACALCLTFTPAARAQDVDVAGAKAQLQTAVGQVIEILSDPAYNNQATHDAREKDLEAVVYGIFDFTAFTAGTIGPRWRTFSNEEKQGLIDAFADLLRATYLSNFKGYHGEEVLYQGEAVQGKTVEIRTVIQIDKKQISVNYKLMQRGDTWVVFDVVAEGMSLVQNYRTQFQDALIKDSAAQLIIRIQNQARVVRGKGAQISQDG
jgi:phospholipid transport system substrate-binding protein